MSYARIDEIHGDAPVPRTAGRVVFELPLETSTPIYGGGVRTRRVDRVDLVRVPSIRGQLRFWWRALARFERPCATAEELYALEREVWGGLGGDAFTVTASDVRVTVTEVVETEVDSADVDPGRHPDAYVLWPARAPRGGEASARAQGERMPAERREPGLKFKLGVECSGKERRADVVRATLRAWIAFGGIGGRTRRGCGALALATESARAEWLPPSLRDAELRAWLEPAKQSAGHFPHLHGSELAFTVRPRTNATTAWREAFGWLREFRQGCSPTTVDPAEVGRFARRRPVVTGGARGRAGRSRWPEADKIRRHFGPGAHDHAPLELHGPQPAWPRAQFGLPIQFQFQPMSREGTPYPTPPPPRVALAGSMVRNGRTEVLSRLASPLILKPMQLRNGDFASVALWLSRRLPDITVGLEERARGVGTAATGLRAGSHAPLDRMKGADDGVAYAPLENKTDVRDAFLTWLSGRGGVTRGAL